MAARPAIGRITVAGDREMGSGFAISATHFLTAFHCVRDATSVEPTAEPIAIHLGDLRPVPAMVEQWDAVSDIAVLALGKSLPSGWEPVVLARPNESLREAAFQARGFPGDRPFPALPLTAHGHVVEPWGEMADGVSALELYCEQVAAGRDPRGFSGAPVRVQLRWHGSNGARSGWAAVGLVRWAQPEPKGGRPGYGGTVFASPVAAIADDCPAVAQLLVQGTAPREDSEGGGWLGDYPLSFRDELRSAEEFVGREELLVGIQRCAEEYDCGYVHLEASAGLGKTALAARFAALEQAPVFFADSSRGTTRAEQCLQHLGAELILRHDLDPELMGKGAGADSTTLTSILNEVVDRNTGPVWIVVDGLDEAEPAQPGANPLLLPPRLPHGVFVLVTSREPAARLQTDPTTPLHELQLSAEGLGERADLERYVEYRVKRETKLEQALASATPPIAPPDFAARMAVAAEGNFMYVTYALADLADGTFDFRSPPRRLAGYYENRFWRQMEEIQQQSWKDWDELHRPVLARLAVAAEPVDVDWLAAQVARPAREIDERVLRPWQRFLRRVVADGSQRWRIVHRSFADFLDSKLDLKATHQEVAAAIGAVESPYRQRHLTEHLRAGGQTDELVALVRDPEWQEQQLAADPPGRLLVHDFEQAWRALESIDEEALRNGSLPSSLGLQVWCALAVATVRSSMQAVPPALLAALVEEGMWTLERARETVRHSPDPAHRARGLLALAHWEPDLAEEAFAAAQEVRGELSRKAEVVAAVTDALPEKRRFEVFRELLDQAKVDGPYSGPYAAEALVSRLPNTLLPVVFEIAHAAPSLEQASLLLSLTSRCGGRVAQDPVAREVFLSEGLPLRLLDVLAIEPGSAGSNSAVALFSELDSAGDRFWTSRQRNGAGVLKALAPRLDVPSLQRAAARAEEIRLFDTSVEIATALARAGEPAAALEALAAEPSARSARALASLGESLPANLVDRALEIAADYITPYHCAEAIGSLARHLPDAERRASLEGALVRQGFADEDGLAAALEGFSTYLQPTQAAEALSLLGRILLGSDLAVGLSALAPALPQDRLTPAFRLADSVSHKGEDVARAAIVERLEGEELQEAAESSVLDEEFGAGTAVALARKLDAAGREQLLVWLGIGVASQRATAVLALSPHLSAEQLERARSMLDEDDDRRLRALRAISGGSWEDEPSLIVDLAEEIPGLRSLAELTANALEKLADDGAPEDALKLAGSLRSDIVKSRLLERLRGAPGADLDQLLQVALGISDWDTRLRALNALVDGLGDASLRQICAQLLDEADHWASTVPDEEQRPLALRQRRASLLPLYARLPAQDRVEFVAELDAWLAESGWEVAWQILRTIDPAGKPLPAELRPALNTHLGRVLHGLSRRPRAGALASLSELAPVVVGIGGTQAAASVGEAILDIGKRWP